MPDEVLAADDLSVSYGPIKAVRGCSFSLCEGETVAVVGANGAGKTTIMRALSNLIPHQGGVIKFEGRTTKNVPAYALARAGLLHVPEGRGVLGRITVLENLQIAFDVRPSVHTFEHALETVFARFPRLKERQYQYAGLLSGGEQQMLALARAIVNPPKVLLVDEPSLGLAPRMIRETFDVLTEFRRAGMAVLLVEQNVRHALMLADRGYVLRQGEVVMEGIGKRLLEHESELKQYLVSGTRKGRRN
jgi:branched-chain amino acid transport system ATP-binding protein